MYIFKPKGQKIEDEVIAKLREEFKWKGLAFAKRDSLENSFDVDTVESKNATEEFLKDILKEENETFIQYLDYNSKVPFILSLAPSECYWFTNDEMTSMKSVELSKSNFLYETILKEISSLSRKIDVIKEFCGPETVGFIINKSKIYGFQDFLSKLTESNGVHFSNLKFLEKKTFVPVPQYQGKTYPTQTGTYTPPQTPQGQAAKVRTGEVIFSDSTRKSVVEKLLKVTMGRTYNCFQANAKILMFRKYFLASEDSYLVAALDMYGVKYAN